jgi:hypothetical protein
MNQYVYIHIPDGSRRNFQIGLDQLIWGWENRSNGAVVRKAFERLGSSPDPTYLVFAEGLSLEPRSRRAGPDETGRDGRLAAGTMAADDHRTYDQAAL